MLNATILTLTMFYQHSTVTGIEMPLMKLMLCDHYYMANSYELASSLTIPMTDHLHASGNPPVLDRCPIKTHEDQLN